MAENISSLAGCLRYLLVFQVLFYPVQPALKFAWTLSPRFVNFDIKSDEFHGQPVCSTKGPQHPDTGYDSLRLSRKFSHIDIQVVDAKVYNKFSFIIFVSLTNDEGTIFQIQQILPGNLYEYLGVFYNTTNLYVQTTDSSLADHVTVTSNGPIQKNQWVGIGVEYENEKVELLVGNDVTGPVAVPHALKLMFPGVVRIGSGFLPDLVDAEGLVTCFSIHDSPIDSNDFTSALDTCHHAHWPSAFIQALDMVVGSCPNKTGHFSLFHEDSMPDSSIIIDQLETPSRIRCADWCAQRTTCLSFSMNPSTRSCILYSEHGDLITTSGTHYYIRSELLACC